MTPFDIFFNKYEILGINFFNLNDSNGKQFDTNSFVYKFRISIASWFYAIRTIACAILLCVLIYVGIRMAISTVASDKAKYKKMLADWICSLILIFAIPYMAIAVIYVNDAIVNTLSLIMADGKVASDVLNDLVIIAISGVGTGSLVAVFVFCMIVGQTIFFFIGYLNRVIKIGFLMIISPLISLTYSIDKMGDGKAQALNIWLKEFIYTILIQPFHCIIYIALINTSLKLIKDMSISVTDIPESLIPSNSIAGGILAIICLKFVSDAEDVVRKIFGFADDNKKTSMAAGAIAAVALVKNAQKWGGVARKGINTTKNFANRLGVAAGHDKEMIKNSKIFQKMSNSKIGEFTKDKAEKAKGFANKHTDALKQNDKFQKATMAKKNLSNKVSTLKGKYKGTKLEKAVNKAKQKAKRALPGALGIMGMAMVYASGGGSLLEANAARKGITDSTGTFFNTSEKSQAEFEQKNNQDLDDAEYEELNEKHKEAEDNVESKGFGRDVTAEQAHNIANSDEAKKANDDVKSANEYKDGRKEKYLKAINDTKKVEEKIAKLQEEKVNAKNHKDRKDAQKKIDEANEELKKKQIREDNTRRAYERAEEKANELQKEADRYNSIESAVAKRDALKNQKDNFYKEENIKTRIANRANGPSSSELERKKNEIIKLIMQLQLEQANEHESDQRNLITTDASDNAISTTDKIVKAVDMSVLKGGASIKASDYIKEAMGLDSDNEATLKSINKSVLEYERLKKEASVAQAFSRQAQYNGDPDSLVDAMAKLMRDTPKETKDGAQKG